VEGSTASYRIRLAWTGNDPDGYVARFEFALDPPAVFSESEIDGVGEGITSEVLPGEDGAPDTTRVTKVADGQVATFDWVHTTDFSRRFNFTTPEADSTFEGSRKVPLPRFHGIHAVYVRAVDDQEAVSLPDHVGFTATTVTPTAGIASPIVSKVGVLTLNPEVRVTFTGSDPDAPGGTGHPIAYEYKLVDLSGFLGWIPVDPHWLFYQLAGAAAWSRVEETTVELHTVPSHAYAFAVRAADVAGAEEPFLD